MGSQQTAASPLRLAILEADAPQPQTAAAYGTYGGLFASLFGAAVERYEQQPLSSALHITKHDVVNFPETAYPSLDDIDALLITGSRHSAYDGDEWIRRLVDYTRSAIEGGRVKVVGVCFGHQIVALALGGRVARNEKGWEVSVMDVQLNEEGKRVFGLEKMVGPGRPLSTSMSPARAALNY